MNGNRNYTGFGPLTVQLFFKIDTEGDKTRCAVISVISRPEPKRHRPCIEDGLVILVIGRCALVARLWVGGGRIQTG